MTEQTGRPGVTGNHTVNGTPIGYTAITPFIVTDKPTEAIAFYEKVFGAKLKNATAFGSGDQAVIVHAELDFGNGRLQLGAPSPEFRTVLPPGDGYACYSLGLYVPDVDRVLEHAVAHGAVVREPARDFVSGDRFASIFDPCGIRWSIMSRVEDLSEEESNRRVNEWSKSVG